MHPALSVILFTTLSGPGFGLLFWLGLWPTPTLPWQPFVGFGWVGFILGFALAVGGLFCSTLHLGHPERAWRAFSQWRSSWLSREGVFAVASLLVFGIFALFWLFMARRVWPIGWLGAGLAVATVYATGMIYAQMRSVQLWNTWLTPACYLLFAAAGGLIAFAGLRAAFGFSAPLWPALILLILAWALKLAWLKRGDDLIALSTPETATGLGRIGRVRMLEPPHTGSNYLLKEMGFQIGRKHAATLRRLALILGGAAPAVLLILAMLTSVSVVWIALAFLCHLAGVLAERWLFFAEARHAVMSYYDRRAA